MNSQIIPLISLGNEVPVFKDTGTLEPGKIFLANEARFSTATFSEPLTAYAVGFPDRENIQSMIDFVAPRVPVGRRFEYKAADSSVAFVSEIDDERAIGSGFKRVEYAGKTQNAKTKNRGLAYRLDVDEEGGILTPENVVALLINRLRRNKLRRVFTALLAVGVNTNKTWDNTSTPDEDMRAAVAAAQLDSGVFPNRAVIGLAAWNKRKSAYAPQNNAGAYAGLSSTPSAVAADLGLDDMKTSRELFQVSTTAKQRIMTSTWISFYAQDVISKDDPSHLKNFVTPMAGGDYRVYQQQVGAKFLDISVEAYDDVIGTSTVGSQKVTVS